MAFVWTSVNVGDIIEYDPALLELRTNADWLETNKPVCITVDVAINPAYCYSYQGSKMAAADGAYCAANDGSNNSKV
jgi:hypothetical protein